MQRYVARPVRPLALLAARAGLWLGVVLGSVGGIVGLTRSPGAAQPTAAPQASDTTILPASVAGTAEVAVRAWLTASPDQHEELDELFVEPPDLPDHRGLTVQQVTAVSGQRLQDGYWTVTVETRVVEADEGVVGDGGDVNEGGGVDNDGGDSDDAAAGEPPGDGDPARPITWFVEVGVVGQDGGGLAALTTPGILPGLPAVVTDWARGGPSPTRPDEDDPIAALAEGFLAAVLAGEGDPARYVAPDSGLAVSWPAQFQTIEVVGLSVYEPDDGGVRAWAEVDATTPGGTSLAVAYELLVAERAGRWEVVELWGSPTVTRAPSAEAEQD